MSSCTGKAEFGGIGGGDGDGTCSRAGSELVSLNLRSMANGLSRGILLIIKI